MFIHLGGDDVVSKHEVIAILNSQLMKKTEVNKEFMQVAENEGFITYINKNSKGKSVIITTKKVYISPISSMTLKKRSDEGLSGIEETSNEEP